MDYFNVVETVEGDEMGWWDGKALLMSWAEEKKQGRLRAWRDALYKAGGDFLVFREFSYR